MFRIDSPSNVQTLPPLREAGAPGFFSEGITQTGRLATVVSQDWLNILQEEIIAVIDYAAIPLAKPVMTQLRDALIRIIQPYMATDHGTTNAFDLWLPRTPPEITPGFRVLFRAATSNTGHATLTVNGQSGGVVRHSGGALEGGEILAGWLYGALWIGDAWQLVEQSAGAVGVAAASRSQHAIQLGQFVGLFDGRWQELFGPAFNHAWETYFDDYFRDRFHMQFPALFNYNLDLRFPDKFQQMWTDFTLPNYFAHGFGARGWMDRPHGIIEQWGTDVSSAGFADGILFPRAFPNRCVNVVAVEGEAGGWGWPPNANPTFVGVHGGAHQGYFLIDTVAFVYGTPPYFAGGITFNWRAIGH